MHEALYLSPRVSLSPCVPAQGVTPPPTQLLRPEAQAASLASLTPSAPHAALSALLSPRAPLRASRLPAAHPTHTSPSPHHLTSRHPAALPAHATAGPGLLGPKSFQATLQPKPLESFLGP